LILLALALLFFILLSCFASGMETAGISANRVRLTTAARAGDKRAQVALKLLATPDRLITTCLVVNNITLVGASFVATAITAELLPPGAEGWTVPITSLALTPLLLVAGDLLPKTVGRAYADGLTLALARPLQVLDWVLKPVSAAAFALSRLILRLRGLEPGAQQQITREELRVMMRHGAKAKAIDDRTARMVGLAFGFSSRDLREVMTPLAEVPALPVGTDIPRAFAAAVEADADFIVVYRERVDAVVGVAAVSELVRAPLQATLERVMAEPLFVPEGRSLRAMLETFHRRQTELAVVVDEYGSVLGVVGLQDVVGAITEASQEGLAAPGPLERGGSVSLPADLPLAELAERYEVELPQGGYATLGGFLIARLERIPRAGEEVVHGEYRLRVQDATPSRVVSVVLERRH